MFIERVEPIPYPQEDGKEYSYYTVYVWDEMVYQHPFEGTDPEQIATKGRKLFAMMLRTALKRGFF